MNWFRQVGIKPNSRLGQNFLIDLNLLDVLLESAGVTDRDVVLEVGTGTASLTSRLAELAARVVTVELDPRLHQLASEVLMERTNVTLIHGDILKSKSKLNADVLDAVHLLLAEDPARRFKLVGNLPYHVATPLISNLLAGPHVPVSMTMTVQKELADRLTAAPGTKDFGALSVWVQSQCRVELARALPPTVFWPRPAVHSAIVHVVLDEGLRQRVTKLEAFHQLVRALFGHRRKYVRFALSNYLQDINSGEDADSLLARLNIPATCRAEEICVDDFVRLSNEIEAAARVLR